MQIAELKPDLPGFADRGTCAGVKSMPDEIENPYERCKRCEKAVKVETWVKEKKNLLQFRAKAKLKKRITWMCPFGNCVHDAEKRQADI